jgi:hypothetical protein
MDLVLIDGAWHWVGKEYSCSVGYWMYRFKLRSISPW